MGEHACLCGTVGCRRHGRRLSKSTGAWGGAYQTDRARLLARWNADHLTRCHICHAYRDRADPWEPDHLIPVDQGGGNGANLVPAHRSCNRRRGAQYMAAKRKRAAEDRAARRIAETVAYLEERRTPVDDFGAVG